MSSYPRPPPVVDLSSPYQPQPFQPYASTQPSYPPSQPPSYPPSYPSQPYSNNQPAYTNNQPAYPNTQPAYPNSQTAYPNSQPGYQSNQPAYQSNQPAYSNSHQPPYQNEYNPGPLSGQNNSVVNPTGYNQYHNNNAPSQSQRQSYTPYVRPAHIIPCPTALLAPTMSVFPATAQVRSKTNLPIGVIVQPLAPRETLPTVNYGNLEVIRCKECRAYLNPYVIFPPNDRGSRWRCNLCHFLNDVPQQYVNAVSAEGIRVDCNQRFELCHSAFDIIAPAEYAKRPPPPPIFMFIIDVSRSAIACGSLNLAVQEIKNCLDYLPGGDRTQVGFITYDSRVHFYNLRSTLRSPHMLVVSELDSMFVPSLDDLVVNLSDSRVLVDMLLAKLGSMHSFSKDNESAMGVAMEAAYTLISPVGGKCILIVSALPSLGTASLRNRDNPKFYGTDKEQELLKPAISWFKDLAMKCSFQQISVDVFCFSVANRFLDVASFSQLSRFSGGQCFFYKTLDDVIDFSNEDKFRNELRTSLTREQGLEAVMRVRCSKGLAITTYHGNFLLRGTDLVALPMIDSDKSFAIEMRYEENATNVHLINHYCIQAAVLYSTTSGERRIRVLTTAVPVSHNLCDLWPSILISPLVNLLCKTALEIIISENFFKSREFIQNRCISILGSYRSSGPGLGRLPLSSIQDYPDSLMSLPLLTLCMLKHAAFKDGSDVCCDLRSYLISSLYIAPISFLDLNLRPRLVCLTEMISDANLGCMDPTTQLIRIPQEIALSSFAIKSEDVYLLDNGSQFIIRVGKVASSEFLNSVFEVCLDSFGAPCYCLRINSNDNSLCSRVYRILNQFRECSGLYQSVSVIVEGSRDDSIFTHSLMLDRTLTVLSYDDFLPHIARSTAL